MRVVIVGGGIAAVYLANNLKKQDSSLEVTVLSDENYNPYDRIHLCRLVDGSSDVKPFTPENEFPLLQYRKPNTKKNNP